MRALGLDVKVYDENISEWCGSEEIVGLGSIGSPYMAAIASRISELGARGISKLIVGGQGIRGLTSDEFSRLFGANTINGSVDSQLVTAQIVSATPPPQESVSIARQIAELSDTAFRLYFSAEVPLYLSQGCRFSCTFCGAERSHPGAAVRERYRELSCVEAELTQIVQRSQALGILENKFYLSNLDLFQTPATLSRFVDSARSVTVAFPNHKLRFRGLSTTNAFMSVYRKSPELIHKFAEVGLEQVGFGIDGATPEVWRAIRKPHSKSNCLDAIAVAREVFDLQPEALMVFGHDGHDDARSLSLAVSTVKFLSDQYGAIPRPHVAKGLVPGNDGWVLGDGGWQKPFLLEYPWAFQFLDFTCLPTDLTHQDPDFRAAVKTSFLEICEMPNCLTQYVLPEDRRLPREQYTEASLFNRGRFDI
ncbi:MAG: Radical superfamily [Sphingomonadales bacterium]|nr:Radical superfamily [Sphingomonadales bacterium]